MNCILCNKLSTEYIDGVCISCLNMIPFPNLDGEYSKQKPIKKPKIIKRRSKVKRKAQKKK